MANGPGVRLRSAIAALQPSPRLVDWSLLAIVSFEVASGLFSFTVASPDWLPLFWTHRVAGLALVPLLGFKLWRVRSRLTEASEWQPSTLLSAVTLLAVLGSLTTGILWVFGLDVRLWQWTLLSVHVGFGLVLLPLILVHVASRFRPPRRADFHRRRTTLRFGALALGGLVAYRGQELVSRVLSLPGADRRFTGSQPREGDGNDAFPVTSWVADDPDPIDRTAWSLTVRGAVERPMDLAYEDLDPSAEREALLDCTSGWYTVQSWRGVRVGDLLEVVDPEADATQVRFVSVTGYRWSLPIEEARDALLATHVGGERLGHGHGAPLRLVAPGRRGFQWVKWVECVDVRRRRDPAQWVVTLVSGFD